MSRLLIDMVDRCPPRFQVRPATVLALTLAAAFSGGLLLQLVHQAEGGHERGEPSPVIHWLRDSTLSLPLLVWAVWLGMVITRNLLERWGRSQSRLATALLLASLTAFLASLSAAGGNPVHEGLFGAHDHNGLAVPLHLARDGLIALAGNLVAIGLVCAFLVSREPLGRPPTASWRGSPRATRRALAGIAIVLGAPTAVLASSGAHLATAGNKPGPPCPAGSHVRTFDVSAVDVPGTPGAHAYVEAHAPRATVNTAPLILHVDPGDCLLVHYTDRARDPGYDFRIEGLPFASVGRATARTRTYRYFIPAGPQLLYVHLIDPGPRFAEAIHQGLGGSLMVSRAP